MPMIDLVQRDYQEKETGRILGLCIGFSVGDWAKILDLANS